MTGITLFENSTWEIFNPIVEKGTDNYIPNYGFGVLEEGRATGDLVGETNSLWKKYYHTYMYNDPENINPGDDVYYPLEMLPGYIKPGYWGKQMNDTKDGYNWIGILANEKPQAMNMNAETGLASKYKFEVKIFSNFITIQLQYGDYI